MATTLETIVQHGLPVLIEKPLGRDLAEARRIAAMLDGHPHMVSLNRRFDPGRAHRAAVAPRSSARRAADIGMMRRRDRAPDGSPGQPAFTWPTCSSSCSAR